MPDALFREQKLYLETNLPVRSILGGDDVVVGLQRGIYRQFAEVEYLADTASDRDDPLIAAVGLPVSGVKLSISFLSQDLLQLFFLVDFQ